MDILNRTGLVAHALPVTDRDGADTALAIVKGTWRIGQDGTLTVADEQVPLCLEPVYHGDPGASSLLHDSDVVLEKPGTDCILLGHAWSPARPVPSLNVTFEVGPVGKTVRVFGERVWAKSLMTSMSQPVPFESLPLVWERSFGGADTSWFDPSAHETCLENPVGRGFVSRKTKIGIEGMLLPNIEDPAILIRSPHDRPQPAGFAPIPSHWHWRARHAGTYDENWRRCRAPLPPKDLDPRFHACAAPGLTTDRHLSGDEPVLVDNASKQGRLDFRLPCVRPQVTLRIGRMAEKLALALDTVIVEPDEERLVLVWRGNRVIHGQVHGVGRVTFEMGRFEQGG